jgi:ABC-type bacteriocin/lantibiotic exporter with double-glycine peptidase domain
MKKLITICLLVSSTCGLQAQIEKQEQSMWCWATCVQSCLSQVNIYQEQSKIVSNLTGGLLLTIPMKTSEVVNILHYYHFNASEAPCPANEQVLLNTLTSGLKLISFVNPTNKPQNGHYIILQSVNLNGQIIVSDPAKGLTYMQSPKQLYNLWNWEGSIVVGTPYKNNF